MSVKTDFDNYEQGCVIRGAKVDNSDHVIPVISLIEELVPSLESPFIDWNPEKVRDLAEIEDFMVNQYSATKNVIYQNPSRCIKGTLNDPVFTSAQDLKIFLDNEIVRKHEKFKYNCEFCDYGHPKKHRYLAHLDTHLKMETESGLIQDTQPVECVTCNKLYKSEYRYQCHVRKTHTHTIKCEVCGTNVSKYRMKCHLQSHNKPSKESCENCGKRYSADQMKAHKLCCTKSVLLFGTTNTYKTPTKTCPICGKSVTTLSQHISEVHDKLKETCDICGIAVGKRSILIHKELHSKIECTECGQYFTETYLKRHRPRCLKIRKCAVEKATVKCEICGKVVGERGLKSHKELHNKVECTTCGEYFTETFLRLKHPKQCKLLLPFFKK